MLSKRCDAFIFACFFGLVPLSVHSSTTSEQVRRPVVQRVLMSDGTLEVREKREKLKRDSTHAGLHPVVRRASVKVDQGGEATVEDEPLPEHKIVVPKEEKGTLSKSAPMNLQEMQVPQYSAQHQLPVAGPASSSTSSSHRGGFFSSFFSLLFYTACFAAFTLGIFKLTLTYYHGPVDIRALCGYMMTSEQTRGHPSTGNVHAPGMHSDWRAKQKEAVHAADMQHASRDFAEQTMKRWKVNKQVIDQRAEVLINALANQTTEEYFHYNDSEHLQEHLKSHDIHVIVDSLKKEIKNGDCQLLRIPSEKSISVPRAAVAQRVPEPDDDDQLVRCVRIVRVVVQGKTVKGMRTLIDGDQEKKEDADHFPTSKVCLNAGSVENAWVSVLHGKLGLSNEWLKQFLTFDSCAETVVEVQTSNKFPGLPTWYIVDEVIVRVNEDGDPSELKLLGLPQGGQFRGTGKHRHRIWLWTDLCKPSERSGEPTQQTETSGRRSRLVNSPEGGGTNSPPVLASKRESGDAVRPENSSTQSAMLKGRYAARKSSETQPEEKNPRPPTEVVHDDGGTVAKNNTIRKARGRSAIRTEGADTSSPLEPAAQPASEHSQFEEVTTAETDAAKSAENVTSTTSTAGSQRTPPQKMARGRSGINTAGKSEDATAADANKSPAQASAALEPQVTAQPSNATVDATASMSTTKSRPRGRSAMRNKAGD